MSNLQEPKILTLERLRRISNLLDNAIAIPGTEYRVGLDPLLGLLPGGGDTLTAFFSTYIVWEAAQMGLPRETLMRMVWNIVFDSLLGTIPVLGDIFDVAWKANVKNISLIETHLNSPIPSKKVDKLFIVLLMSALILFIFGITVVGILIFKFIFSLVTGN